MRVLSFLVLSLILAISAADDCRNMVLTITPDASLNKLHITHHSADDVVFEFFPISGTDIVANVSACGNALDYTLANGVDGALLTAYNANRSVVNQPSSTGAKVSSASRTATHVFSPLVLLLAIFSVSRFSARNIILAALLCALVAAPFARATTIIRVGVPSTITSICDNENCAPCEKYYNNPTAQPTGVPTYAPTNPADTPTDAPTDAPTTAIPAPPTNCPSAPFFTLNQDTVYFCYDATFSGSLDVNVRYEDNYLFNYHPNTDATPNTCYTVPLPTGHGKPTYAQVNGFDCHYGEDNTGRVVNCGWNFCENPTPAPTTTTQAPTQGGNSGSGTGSGSDNGSGSNSGSGSGSNTGSSNSGSSTSAPNPSTEPTNAPSAAPTDAPATVAPTSVPTTTAPTNAPTTTAATTAPTTAPTTPAPTATVSPIVTAQFQLKLLIFADAATAKASVTYAQAICDTVGMPYEVLHFNDPLVPSRLSCDGVGAYAGIIVVKDNWNTTIEGLVTAYIQKYSVRMMVLISSPGGLPGVTAGAQLKGTFSFSLAEGFTTDRSAAPMRPNLSVKSDYEVQWTDPANPAVTPAVITDPTTVKAVVMATAAGSSPVVAAAEFSLATGKQLHVFYTPNQNSIAAMVLGTLYLNWVCPGGIFLGTRRLTMSMQPDDFFLATFIWDEKRHLNPLDETSVFRMIPKDLQLLADWTEEISAALPAGSRITIEWPVNFQGPSIYSTYGTLDDPLYHKALELQDKFWYLSHTYTHPCTFDTADYQTVYGELSNNTAWAPNFLAGGVDNPLWSKTSMVTPCITGVHNGQALKAMWDNGIHHIVGDNTVKDIAPKFPYHAYYTTVEEHGFAGMFIMPREALDIDYDNHLIVDMLDQYHTDNPDQKSLSWEQIMVIQNTYGVQDKVAFRHDPFMFHQANTGFFEYADPFHGGVMRNVSLATIWAERVMKEVNTYYNLPVVSPKMEDLVVVWRQRLELDTCGATVVLGTNAEHQVVSVSTTSTSTCQIQISGVSLSGATVEQVGVEVTSRVESAQGSQQTFAVATPVSLL